MPDKRHRRSGAAAIAGALAFSALAAYAQAPEKKMSYDNFRMVQSRNIFDPDRSRDLVLASPNSQRTEIHQEPTPPPSVQKTDYVELTGVMTTEQETFAFFAGSQPEYNKVVALNGSIAGATITKINSSSIDVQRNGKSITVTVGQTVPFDNSAPGLPPNQGAMATASDGTNTTNAGTTTSAADPRSVSEQVPLPDAAGNTTSPPPPPGESNIDAIRRRLEERRQKELSQ